MVHFNPYNTRVTAGRLGDSKKMMLHKIRDLQLLGKKPETKEKLLFSHSKPRIESLLQSAN